MTSGSNSNQYPVGYEDSLPGAFPETPADESGPPQHNKLHKRDDPRGFTDSNSTPRSHGHTDSGVSAVSGVSSSTPSSSTARGGNYTYEKNGLPDRTRTQDQQQPYASQEQGTSKPGFMTGAYSRVGNNSSSQQQQQPTTTTTTNDSAAARQPTSAINPLSSSSHVHRDAAAASPEMTSSSNTGRHVHIGGGDPATVPGGAAATSANSSLASASASEEGQQQQRNLVRNGRGRTDIDHEDAYWGDIPRGAGVYNTVVGAGSDEKNPATAHPQDRALPHAPAQHLAARDGTSASDPTPQWRNEGVAGNNNGVHNSIIGAGSGEDRSSVSHHREFPLGSSSTSRQQGDATTGTAHPHRGDSTHHHGDAYQGDSTESHGKTPSHFKEHLAEAGVAGAGTGYAADKYAQGHEGNHPTASSGVSSSQQQQHSHTPGTAQQQYSSKPSTTQEHLSEVPGSQPEQEQHHQHHLGRDAALAGAGAGAAGYGAHKYASNNRDDNHEKQSPHPHHHNDASAYQTGNPYSGEDTSSSVPSSGQKKDTYLNYGPAEAAAATGVGAGYGTHTPNPPHQGYTSSPSYAQKDVSAIPEKDATTTTRGNDDDSHFGRNAALAGAGAGAAGYGAHKYAHRDDDDVNSNNKGYASQPQQQQQQATSSTRHAHQPTATTGTEQRTVPAETTSSSSRDGGRHHHNSHNDDAKSAAVAAYNANRDHTTTPADAQRQQAGEYNTLSDGTPSGVNLDRSSQNHPASTTGSRDATRGQGHSNDAKYAAAGTAAGLGAGAAAYNAKKDHSTTTSADSQRQQAGNYNTLNDGTPSGVNLDRSSQNTTHNNNTGATGAAYNSSTGVHKPTTATAPESYQTKNTNTTTTTNPDSRHNNNNSHTGSKTAAAAAGVAGAGAYAAHDHHASGNKQQQQQHNASVSSHSSADSSHGGQYNVLSSGTPSGINISGGDPHHHESPQTLLGNNNSGSHHNNNTTTTSHKGRDTAPSPARYQ